MTQSAETGSGSDRPMSEEPADAGTTFDPAVLPSETAVLVVDVQNDFVDESGRVGRSGSDMRPLQTAVGEINRLITAARAYGAHVVYVVVEHGGNVDLPPYQARYSRRGMTPEDTLCYAGTWGAGLYSALLPPAQGELKLVKHGYDAFQIPDLETTLRQWGIREVVVTGVVTELCVRATATSAFEKGFFAVVPRECTASLEAERALEALNSIEQWYGDVIAIDSLLTMWGAKQSRSGMPA